MSLWRLSKRFTFEASHRLPHHDGKCARLHGHSWVAVVTCEGDSLQPQGPKHNMLLDYGDISAAVKPLVEDHLDHWHLNDSLVMESPTSEAIARWLFGAVRLTGLPVSSVVIEETCTSRCEYREGA